VRAGVSKPLRAEKDAHALGEWSNIEVPGIGPPSFE
jgi:hypothetical protein